jgi:Kdo2-lipid IVA lauroyltransferase/acyltransferase
MIVEPFCKTTGSNERGSCRQTADGSKTTGFLRAAHLLGDLIYAMDRRHRIIVRHNLEFAFPHWTGSQVSHITRQTFRNLGRLVVEIFQLSYLSRDEILDRCHLTGAEHFQQALDSKRGMVLVSAHLGNWEIGLQYLSCRFNRPILLVVQPFSPPPLDRWIRTIRARFGNRIISKKRALPEMMKTNRQGGIVALMVDVSRRKASVAVNFFNQRVRANYASALMAVRCNSPVVAAFSTRNADGSFSIDIPPPIDIKRSGDLKHLLKSNTQLITDVAETAIDRQPDQYMWMQKRWKDYHPYLYPGYRSRLEHLAE